MNVLIIEDEPEFIRRIRDGASHVRDTQIIGADEIALKQPFDESGPVEEQIFTRLGKISSERKIDIVLLDTDLSRFHNGVTQSSCRDAFQKLGIPVCRYSKKQSATPSSDLLLLSRQSLEGSSAVWVKTSIAQDPESQLLPWLSNVYDGFSKLKQALEKDASWQNTRRGPAGILASILGTPSSSADFQGYTAQNLFFFGSDPVSNKGPTTPQQLATRLGYWLLNYILQFPGPILNAPAAAAFLNVTLQSFNEKAVQQLIAPARYTGPFSGMQELYWRDLIGKIIDEADGDIATHKALADLKLQRVDEDNPGSSAFVCVLTQEPIASKDAAPTPDWVPSGAQLARIKTSIYDQLGPLLNI